MLHDILRDGWANAVGVAKFLSPEASCGEAVVVHGKDRNGSYTAVLYRVQGAGCGVEGGWPKGAGKEGAG